MNHVCAIAMLAALFLAGCSGSPAAQSTPHAGSTAESTPTQTPTAAVYKTAQDIVDSLRAVGFKVSKPVAAEPGFVEQVGGTSWNMTIGSDKSRSDGINLFPNPETLATWVELSKSFGGIAVTGDAWAVSLSTDSKYRKSSKALAPKIAEVLGGSVQM